MSDTLKIYDSDQVSVSFSLIPLESGRAEDEFAKIEKTSAVFVTVVGTDGQVTRSKTLDERTKVTLTFMQTSKCNAILSAFLNADKLAANGAGVGVLSIRDRQGTSLFLAPEAWIEKEPDVVYRQKAEARAWTFECANPKRLDGGN